MEINYITLENEVIDALEKNLIWVLSTSFNDYVTSRPMSIVNEGVFIYFQTNKCYIKHKQMELNKQVSLCCQNISIEGIAEEIGGWNDKKNARVLELYKSKHMSSYCNYGMLEGQVLYRVNPIKIKLWKYVDGEPFREVLFVSERRAERFEFM